MKIHKELNAKNRGTVTKEKVEVLEKDIDCLWEKVLAYEEYANEERKLRIKIEWSERREQFA